MMMFGKSARLVFPVFLLIAVAMPAGAGSARAEACPDQGYTYIPSAPQIKESDLRRYPRRALSRHVTGWIAMSLQVNRAGKVFAYKILDGHAVNEDTDETFHYRSYFAHHSIRIVERLVFDVSQPVEDAVIVIHFKIDDEGAWMEIDGGS